MFLYFSRLFTWKQVVYWSTNSNIKHGIDTIVEMSARLKREWAYNHVLSLVIFWAILDRMMEAKLWL